ncbi:MAG: 50S ribosomal protein L17 [Prevotellaceae bacterium]|jgi:large subunit ribosomal protein L17|nr:50S ribosomal protein L17 [Prevotellaceae bacterium]
MRHNKKFNHLGRTASHRSAMLSNMATSLILHKRIATTLAKAKALRVYVEPLLTKSKDDTTHSRRTVFSYLRSKEAIKILFGEISQKIADRPGGYTRILRTGFRLGDNAEMCIIELVDYNENMLKEKAAKKTRTRRAGHRSGGAEATVETGKSTTATPKAEKVVAEKVEEKVEEVVESVQENVEESAAEIADETATEEEK